MIRRLKSDVLDQLPPKIRKKILIDLEQKMADKIKKINTSEILSFFNDMDTLKYFSEYYQGSNILNTNEIPTSGEKYINGQRLSIMEAYRLTGEAKVEGAKKYLETLIKTKAKFLLFCHHKSVMFQYEEFL